MKREKLNTLNERDLLIGIIVSDKFCREIVPVLNPRLLQVEYARIIAGWVREFYNNFKKAPEKDILKLYRAKCEEISDEALQDNVLTFIQRLDKDYESISQFNVDFALGEAVNYLKKLQLQNLNADIDAYLTSGDIGKAENLITKFRGVEKESGKSVSVLGNSDALVNSFTKEDDLLLEFKGAYGAVIGKVHREDFIAFLAPMKRGKCLSYGTKILMADGSIKEVQDIVKGDKLMGVDSTARNVLSTTRGHAEMFRVTSNVNSLCKNKKPDIDFTCNGDHILVLKNVWKCEKSEIKEIRKDGHKNGAFTKYNENNLLKQEEIEISVYDYLKLSDYQKKRLKLFRVKCDYDEKLHKVSPYMLGAWLGDGTSCRADITTTDLEIIERCKSECLNTHDEVSVSEDKRNRVKTITFKRGENDHSVMLTELKDLGLLSNKHIPDDYLIDSEENRLNLLAGIVDTDGYASKDGECIEIHLMNERLANDVKTLCQQLGFRTIFNEKCKNYKGMYAETNGWKKSWVVKITGELSKIPCLLERKKLKDSKKYCSLNNTFSFKIESVGKDDYYGFVLDGDHKFLLADTTVSHNTWALIDAGVTAMMNGLKVLHCSLEMSESQMLKRYWTCMSGQVNEDKDDIDYPYFESDGDKWTVEHKTISRKAVSISEIQKKQKQLKRMFRGGDIRVLAVPAYSESVEMLDMDIENLVQNEGYVPDVIIVDYADIMMPSEKGDYRNQIDGIWKRLRGMAQKRKCVVFTASQSGRASIGKNVDATDIAEDIRKLAHVTSMVSLNQTEIEKKNGILRLKQLAVREGEQEFRQAVCTQCFSIGRIITDSRFDNECDIELEEDDEDKYTGDRSKKK